MDAERISLELLNLMEDREFLSLQWGFVNGSFTEDELLQLATEIIEHSCDDNEIDPDKLVNYLLDHKLIFEVRYSDQDSAYRSRFAETVRLLSKLRQLLPGREWRAAPNLVADYRLLVRPRRYPEFVMDFEEVFSQASRREALSPASTEALRVLLHPPSGSRKLAEFQWRAYAALREDFSTLRSNGLIVCSGTGSGKTLAAYLPALVEIIDLVKPNDFWTKMLCVYPRNELLKDQASSVLREIDLLAGAHLASRPIRLGAFNSSTPFRASYVDKNSEWRRHRDGYICPIYSCPRCNGSLVWPDEYWQTSKEQLRCDSCTYEIGDDRLVLTRERMAKSPPDLVFTSTESLNRQLAHTHYRKIFGAGQPSAKSPRCVLLDEVHTYEGVPGAQVGLLLRRWRYATGHRPVQWIGLSATLRNPLEFFSQLIGLPTSRILHVEPKEQVSQGREYLIALRGDPASPVSLLSTTIQASMLMGRILDPQPNNPGQKYEPPSRGAVGRRAFLFTDDLDVTNRLYHDILSAEGRQRRGATPLADLRSSGADEPDERDILGQNWWMPEEIGHPLHAGQGLRIDRTSSQDRGFDELCNIVVCTAALEVGYNDPTVGAVLQHKAPLNLASFLQRKGRAGRPRGSRPWTMVVLSDYGRDRIAYQNPEHLFDPTLEPRRLPVNNRYVMRIQAVYAFMDWMANRADELGRRISMWTSFERPADNDFAREGQRWAHGLVEKILEQPELQADLQEFLVSALGIDDNEALRLLWGHPRPLLTAALPTILRRLATSWRSVQADGREGYDLIRRFNPLPDFVPASLFSDLQLPELEIHISGENTPEVMPLLQGMRSFAPGKVSRRFAGEGAQRSHWIPISGLASETILIESFCTKGERIGDVSFRDSSGQVNTLSCIRPLEFQIDQCPEDQISVTSNASLTWRSQIWAERPGTTLNLGQLGCWKGIIESVEVFTHGQTRPICIRRFADGTKATFREVRQDPRECRISFASESLEKSVAIGFHLEVDGLRICYRPPTIDASTINDDFLSEYRPKYFRELVEHDSQLLEIVNIFKLGWLAEIHLAALSEVAVRENLTVSEASDRLAENYLACVDHVMADILQMVDVTDNDSDASSLRIELRELFQIGIVQERLRALESVLWDPPNEQFFDWIRARYLATLGGAFLEACHVIGSRSTSGDLLLDIDSGITPEVAGDELKHVLWITETSPGGNGVIEEIAQRINNDPKGFLRTLTDAIAPSDHELIDTQLMRILSLMESGNDGLANSIEGVRNSRGEGELSIARDGLLRTLKGLGLNLSRPFLVALNARLLPSGSTRARDNLLATLVRHRQLVEEKLGFELNYRELAFVASNNEEVIESLTNTIGDVWDGHERFLALVGLLWPRASNVRGQVLAVYNPYCELPSPDRRLVENSLANRPIRISAATEYQRDLVTEGQLSLFATQGDESQLRRVLLDMAAHPLEVDYLHVYPRVMGITSDEGLTVTVDIEEVLP